MNNAKAVESRFQKGGNYPFWGTKISTHRILINGLGPIEKMHLDLLALDNPNPSWEEIYKELASYIDTFWLVNLFQPIEKAKREPAVFKTLKFSLARSQRPLPPSFKELVEATQTDLLANRFFYLEPVWQRTVRGLKLVNPKIMKGVEKKQRRQIMKRLRRQQWLRWPWPSAVKNFAYQLYDPLIVMTAPEMTGTINTVEAIPLFLVGQWK